MVLSIGILALMEEWVRMRVKKGGAVGQDSMRTKSKMAYALTLGIIVSIAKKRTTTTINGRRSDPKGVLMSLLKSMLK